MRIEPKQLLICSVVLLLIACDSRTQGFAADAIETQLRDEAPLAWERLEAKHHGSRFDWKEKHTSHSSDEQSVTLSTGSNYYRGNDFLVRLKDEGKDTAEAWGGNARNLFTVSRSSDSSPWMLSRFAARSTDPTSNGDIEYGSPFRIPWQIFDVPCRELIAAPGFTIKSLKPGEDASINLVFTCDPRHHDGSPQLTSGEVSFLPERDWAISQYEVQLTRPDQAGSPPVIVTASVEYGPDHESFLNIHKTGYELRWQSSGKQRWNRWEMDISAQRCDEPEEYFTLASFSLPEPALPSSERARPWVWLNVAAIVCLIVAIILRSRLRRV